MQRPFIFEHIHIDIPYRRIYSRLGFHFKKTRIDDDKKREIDSLIHTAAGYLELKGAALRIPVIRHTNDKVELITGDVMRSKKLSRFLRGSSEVLLMGATAGKNMMERMEELKDTLSELVVYDAVAGEMTDAALEYIRSYYGVRLNREGKMVMSKRFSAGYGDFDLENQMMFYNFLELSTLDIDITDNYILIPEKSVTAVTGIGGSYEG